MADENRNSELQEQSADPLVPGTYQIRKITSRQNSMELLATAEHLAAGGYEKKLFGVLSRVYTEHKGFHYEAQEGMEPLLRGIVDSDMPTELKMQTFTSFEIPKEYRPSVETAQDWVKHCAPKRINIAGYFLADYEYGREFYPMIVEKRNIFKIYVQSARAEAVLEMFEEILEKEKKEYITGVIRQVRTCGRRFYYTDREVPARLSEKVFASKEVFFTSKLLYCLAFSIPADCLPPDRELYKILKIAINYEEKTTREFVKRYHMDFDLSDEALCRYFLGNKKTDKERPLVEKFAAHVVLIEDEGIRRKLLHGAFKRGGMFRMYAGCMQEGRVDEVRQKRFHYTDEAIAWVKTLPGLNDK